ncbi:MAG: hypothetical protein ACFFFC_20490 [Candidatus Thorarchaeota archaeon]
MRRRRHGGSQEINIDFEATKRREAFIKAELDRILKNDFESRQRLARGALPHEEALVEATLRDFKKDAKKRTKEADLVLTVNISGTFYPLLVIELKKRVEGSPTKTSQKALRQAYDYARQIGCEFYSIYDGHVFVLMQFDFTYLIGQDIRYSH